ncbi:MAG: type II secretion system protein [Clostridia bacterium]|nr:type II secretion system protein [Clostridia bacterium]
MKKLKKAFTLTELVIVIAVIAILAAVLIPTYTSLVRKANISSDTQLATTFNSLISNATSMQEVVDILDEEGYGIGKLNPTTENCRFVWDAVSKQILFVDENFNVLYNSRTYNLTTGQLWLTVKTPSEVITTNKCQLNYFLTQNSSQNFALTTLSSFDTGKNILKGTLSINSLSMGNATIKGVISTLSLNTPNANISQYGRVDSLNIAATDTHSLYGYAGDLEINSGNLILLQASYVKNLVVKSTAVYVANSGIVDTLTAGQLSLTSANFSNNGGMVTNNTSNLDNEDLQTENFSVNISTLAQLEAFRDSVNGGATYIDVLVKLTDDIVLNDGWVPIGAFARTKVVKGFQGTFDGDRYTISNLNNTGYDATTVALGSNDNSIRDKQEYVYGLFGFVSNAIIKNLNIVSINIDIPTGALVYGDGVAALIGYSFGDLQLENIVIGTTTDQSKIKAFDGVAGLVGRTYGLSTDIAQITISSCVNNAQVQAGEKAGGFVGSPADAKLTFLNSDNYGVITIVGNGTVRNWAVACGFVSQTNDCEFVFTNCESNGNLSVQSLNGQTEGWTIQTQDFVYVSKTLNQNKNKITSTSCTENNIKTINGVVQQED